MNLAQRFFHGLRRLFRRPYYADDESQIGESSEIDEGAVIVRSTLGRACRVGTRTEVADSQLADQVRVGRDADVIQCTIAPWVSLQAGVELIDTRLGSFSYVARRARLIATTTGAFCSIGPNVICGCGEHPAGWMSTSPVFYSEGRQCGRTFAAETSFEEVAPVTIGSDCWIGANAFIRNGVSIGHGAIVAANAAVVKDVAPYEIVGGVPAKRIRFRFEPEIITGLLETRWWEFPVEVLEREAKRFRGGDGAEFLRWAREVRAGL